MKKLLLLFILLSTVTVQCQDFIKTYEGFINKEKVYLKLYSNSGVVTGDIFEESNCLKQKVEGIIKNSSFNFSVQFDDFESTITESGKIEGYKKEGEKNKFYFIPTQFNFKEELSKCKPKKEKNTLVVYDIKVLKYPATKDSGKAWDNAFGQYKPDVYFKILDKNKNAIFSQNITSRLENHNGSEFNLLKVAEKQILKEQKNCIAKIPLKQHAKGLFFCLYDYDSATSDDLIGVVAAKNLPVSKESNLMKKMIEIDGFKIEVEYYYQ
ncbi:hypothetical protein ACIVBQ_000581 [Tenacibaculum discolor]